MWTPVRMSVCTRDLSDWDLRSDSTAPRYSPRSTTVSVSTTEQWEKELMQDPKVFSSMPAAPGTVADNSGESPRPFCPLVQRSQCYPDSTLDHHRGHPKFQHQDSSRRRPNHQPTRLRAMLALCCDQCLSSGCDAQAQFKGISAQPGTLVLLGQT